MNRPSPASFEIGVDEAGYGPLLGPLVVGAVRVDGPPGALGKARGFPGLPLIDDSKRVYSGANALARLETTALAAFSLGRGRAPETLADLVGDPSAFDAHPWYGGLRLPLPLATTPAAIARAADSLESALRRDGARLAFVRAVARPELALNAAFAAEGGKGPAHLGFVAHAFAAALTEAPQGRGRIDCDRLGGRKDYAPLIGDVFPFRAVETRERTDERSAYVVAAERGPLDVSFQVGGESHAPCIALASCVAKYVREACMKAFNAHFAALVPGLVETAGYRTDGPRFLNDLVRATGDESWRGKLSRAL